MNCIVRLPYFLRSGQTVHRRLPPLPIVGLVLSALVLSGCETTPDGVQSHVTVFHRFANSQAGNQSIQSNPAPSETNPMVSSQTSTLSAQSLKGSKFIVAGQDVAKTDIEFAQYQQLIAAQLTQLGLVETKSEQKDAQIEVRFSYQMDKKTVAAYSVPAVRPYVTLGTGWGWGRGRHPGSFGRIGMVVPFGGGFYDPPLYADPALYQSTVYERVLKIDLFDLSKQQTIWQATVKSEGSNANRYQMMPYLLRAAFSKFPGESGVTHVVVEQFQDKPSSGVATTKP